MRRRLALVPAVVLMLSSLVACGGDSGDSSDSGDSDSDITGVTVTGDFGKEPKVEVDGLDESETTSDVIIDGDGPELEEGGAAKVHVLMAKGTDGSTIQSSYSSPDAQTMQLTTVPAWIQDALSGVSIGSRVLLVTPLSTVNNGEAAPDLDLKADDDVVFVFDLVEAAEATLTGPEGESVDPPADAPKAVDEDGTVTSIDFSDAPKDPPTEFEAIPLIEGDGQAVKEGDTITVNYIGQVWGEDEAFESSYEQGQPATFQLVYPGLIEGWLKGLEGLEVGSRVMLVVPPDLAYGKKGSDCCPPNSTLVFVIDVLGVGG